MPLQNHLSSEARARLIDEAGHDRITLSFYKYHPIPDPAAFRDELFAAWDKLEVLGRIYVATEGINAQMSVPAHRFDALKTHLDGYDFLRGIRLNVAVEQHNKSFLKLKIKVRNQIVADGISDPTFDATRTGSHLRASDFNALIANPDTLLVDMRNHYESEIGHFEGALKPDVDTFRESLDIVTEALKPHGEDKPVAMYCTGGIRCEKASAYLRHKGFKQVFQLEGGVIEYLRQVKSEKLENRFKGKNFVFDERMAERISDDIVSTCHLCGAPSDTHRNCTNEMCHVLMIQCEACREKLNGCCSTACHEVSQWPEAERRLKRKGRGAPKRYFKRTP
jgi:UPF0176 protein